MSFWDDPVDVYRVQLARGQRLRVRAAAHWPAAHVYLTMWRPGTHSVLRGRKGRVARTRGPGTQQRLSYRAPRAGWYYVKLRVTGHGSGRYGLQLSKTG